jgi:hypothetical protein
MSVQFKRQIGTERLFLSLHPMLVDEGVVPYFSMNLNAASTTNVAHEIDHLLEYIHSYVGGRVFPLM